MAPTGSSAPQPSVARIWALALLLACAGAAAQGEERSLEFAPGKVVRYRVVHGAAASARPAAEEFLRHLAAGDIESAAVLSNAPRRRYEELAKYRDAVGAEAFKLVYSRYFAPANRLVAEVAIGERRLLMWDLGEARHHIAGQFWVEIEGRFFMDDAPSEARSSLRHVLDAYRQGRLRF